MSEKIVMRAGFLLIGLFLGLISGNSCDYNLYKYLFLLSLIIFIIILLKEGMPDE